MSKKTLSTFFLKKYETTVLFEKNLFFLQSRFKKNYKYFSSLLFKNNLIFFLGLRSFLSLSIAKFNKKNRYITVNYFMLYNISTLLNYYVNYGIIFFYKNMGFAHISFLENFFKLCSFFFLKEIDIVLNFNLIFQQNKYWKKVKTIKKFKKKIYYKSFKHQLREVYN